MTIIIETDILIALLITDHCKLTVNVELYLFYNIFILKRWHLILVSCKNKSFTSLTLHLNAGNRHQLKIV